jgi:hypothetical protein
VISSMIRTAAAVAMRMAAIVRTVELDIRPQRFYDRLRNVLKLLLLGNSLTEKDSQVSESQKLCLRMANSLI